MYLSSANLFPWSFGIFKLTALLFAQKLIPRAAAARDNEVLKKYRSRLSKLCGETYLYKTSRHALFRARKRSSVAANRPPL